jgi:hypothetical protein
VVDWRRNKWINSGDFWTFLRWSPLVNGLVACAVERKRNENWYDLLSETVQWYGAIYGV